MGVTAKTHSQECCRYLYHLNTWDFVSMKLKALFIPYKYEEDEIEEDENRK